jgi:hypothetical protein
MSAVEAGMVLELWVAEERIEVLVAPRSDAPAYARTPSFSLSVRADEQPVRGLDPRADELLRLLTAVLRRADPGDLLVPHLSPDAERPSSPGQEDAVVGASGEGGAADETGRAPTPEWASFFAGSEYEDVDPNWVDERLVLVEYSDRECFFSHSEPDARTWSYFNDPRLPLPSRFATSPSAKLGPVVAELGEADVVLGTDAIHDAIVDAVGRRAEQTDLVLVNHLCTPLVFGDDLGCLARRCGRAAAAPVIEITREAKEQGSLFEQVLRAALGAQDWPEVAALPDAVNLFGFALPFCEQELDPFIEALGLQVSVRVLPDVAMASLLELSQAAVFVVCVQGSHSVAVARQLADLPRQVIEVPAPYGPEATGACLTTLAAQVARAEQGRRLWEERRRAFADGWTELRQQAGELRLGLVVGLRELERLLEPTTGDVDVAGLLMEMGFGLDFVVYAPTDVATEQSRSLAAPLLARDNVRLRCFDTPAALQAALRDSSLRAVYSDFFFDHRLSRAGKAQFSRRHFEMGLGGAQRSLAGLLAASRVPFYERYARHLDRFRGAPND